MFLRPVAYVAPKTRVPVVAIVLHATVASLIAISGTYEQIINWVVGPQWLFTGVGAAALFIFRKRDRKRSEPFLRVPGHPYTTIVFLAAIAGILIAEVSIYPRDTLYGAAVLVSGAIAFAAFRPSAKDANRR